MAGYSSLWQRVLLIWTLQLAGLVVGLAEVGCFSSLPSSFSGGSTYEYQSSAHCASQCQGSKYLALYNHNQCFCGDENPSGQVSTSDQCNAYCYGYKEEMCGGSDAYLVYAFSDADAAQSGESESSSATDSDTTTLSTTGTTSNSGGTTTSTTPGTTPTTKTGGTTDAPSIVYSTSIMTVGGSVQYVTTNVVTASAESSDQNNDRDSDKKKKKTPVGPIVGGVVGGIVGLVLLILAVVFSLRHVSKRRENERMEKEYQEAIKPVDYDEAAKENYYASSLSDHMHTGDSGNSGEPPAAGALPSTGYSAGARSRDAPIPGGPPTGGPADLSASGSAAAAGVTAVPPSDSQHSLSNPFADSRRISNGSLLDQIEQTNKLTVVNPDE